MILIPVKCPDCSSTDVVKYGKKANGEQRYFCNNSACERQIFLLNYDNKGFSRSIRMHDIVIGLFINRFEFCCSV